MAASDAVTAFRTVLIWNYREVLELKSISGPTQSRDMLEVTSHDSDNGFKEYITGPIAGGEVSIDGNLIVGDTHGQVAFHTDIQGGTKRNAFIVGPMAAAQAWSFAAFAKGFEGAFPYDSKIGVSGSLIVTGKPTYLTSQSAGMSALSGHEYDGESVGEALSITEDVAVGTYAYTCEVTNSDQDGVKLAITAASHTIYAQGVSHTSAEEGDIISLGAAGTDTVIFIMVYETSKAPRLYRLTVTRPAA